MPEPRRGVIVARYEMQTVPIVGRPHQVEAVLRNADRRGELVTPPAAITPRRVGENQVSVTVDMLVKQPPPGTRREAFAMWRRDHPSEWRWIKNGALAMAVLGAFLGLAFLVASAVSGVVAALSAGAGTVLAVLVVVLLVAAARFRLRRPRHYCETTVTHRHHH